MASYHVISATGKYGNYRVDVEFHIPIPDEQNTTSTSTLRDALVADPDVDKTTTVGTAQEQTDMATGNIFKHLESVLTHEAKTLAQKRADIRARYDDLAVSVVDQIRSKYAFTNFEEIKGVDF